MSRCDTGQYIKFNKQNIKTLSQRSPSRGMSDELKDSHWVTTVIITGVQELGKGSSFILFFFLIYLALR